MAIFPAYTVDHLINETGITSIGTIKCNLSLPCNSLAQGKLTFIITRLIYQKLSEIITDNKSGNHQFFFDHHRLISTYVDLIISPVTGMTKDNEYRSALIIFVKNKDTLLST